MKKLSLDVDRISVSSFVTDEQDDDVGTVYANDAKTALISCVHVCGTVVVARDDCTSGCACCRFRPAPRPQR